MNIFKSYRKESRTDYGRIIDKDTGLNTEDLKLGAILRIADATEKMAARYTELMAERDRFERWHSVEREQRYALQRQVNALRGVITKMKKKRGETGNGATA